MANEICPVCSGELGPERYGLRECMSCRTAVSQDMSFAEPVYEPGLEGGIYREAKAGLFTGALDLLESRLPGKGRLLDIGCASGGLMQLAAARGWRPEGVELDAALATEAESAGFAVYREPVEKAGLVRGSYDAVVVFEVFCLMAAPAAAAAELSALLKPGGVLYVREFNAAFHLAAGTPPLSRIFGALGMKPAIFHNFNFRVRSLRVLLERAGFRDIQVRNSPPTAGDPYRTGGILGGVLLPAAKVLYYWCAQVLAFLTAGRVLAGSSLLVTARK
jgi:SAM-dependent methyltransferase